MIRLMTFAALLAVPAAAHAQSVPPITRSKQVAVRAADAASDRVRAQTSVTDEPVARDTSRRASADSGTRPAGKRPRPGAGRPGSTGPSATGPATTRAPRPGAAAPTLAAAGATADSARPEIPGANSELVLMRESYRYDANARRDPFVSLLESGDLRPIAADLRLIGVIYDPTGRRSLATLRDITTKELYRVAVGNVLGRTRVTHIQPKQITMTIEEFGYSRQLVLILGDTTVTRTNR